MVPATIAKEENATNVNIGLVTSLCMTNINRANKVENII
jgi:hypothetical protein